MRRLLAALLLFATVPLFAQTTHQVSKITFQSRLSNRILLSQSMLAENRTYSDEELELAMSRLRRLPFVYNATYQFDGSTLIVMVVDGYHFFYDFDSMLAKETIRGGSTGEGFLTTELGGRGYVPGGGIIEGTWGLHTESHLHSTSYAAQYSQYGILGTPAYAILRMDHPTTGGTFAPQLLVGYPLTFRQTIIAHASRVNDTTTEGDGIQVGKAITTTKLHEYSLGWLYDTENDALFVNRGQSFLVEGGKERSESTFSSFFTSGKPAFHSENKRAQTNWHGRAENYWNRGRGAFTGSVDVTYSPGTSSGRSVSTAPFNTVSTKDRFTVITAGYVHNFFSSLAEVPESRHRIEFLVGMTNDKTTFSTHSESISVKQVGVGWAYRNRYGAFHFVLQYMSD